MCQKRMPFSNSRARACSALSSVSSSNSVFRVSGRSFVRQTLRVTVARSCSSVRKLCSAGPSRGFLALRAGRRLRRRHGIPFARPRGWPARNWSGNGTPVTGQRPRSSASTDSPLGVCGRDRPTTGDEASESLGLASVAAHTVVGGAMSLRRLTHSLVWFRVISCKVTISGCSDWIFLMSLSGDLNRTFHERISIRASKTDEVV